MSEHHVTLAYTEWMLVELDGRPVQVGADEQPPSLVLDLEESRVSGSGGVNRIVGTFTLSEHELRFGPLATTLMAGPAGPMRLEQELLAALARVTAYELDGRRLTLLAGDEAVVTLAG